MRLCYSAVWFALVLGSAAGRATGQEELLAPLPPTEIPLVEEQDSGARTITLLDGRTVNRDYTRTVDGKTVTVERNFSGPNGQTRNFESTWTRDGDSVEGSLRRDQTITLRDGRTVNHDFTRTVDGETVTVERNFSGPNDRGRRSDGAVPVAEERQAPQKASFWSKLNPFRRTAGDASPRVAQSSVRRGGFTLGASQAAGARAGGTARSHRNWTPGGQPAMVRQASAERSHAMRQQHAARGREKAAQAVGIKK